MKPFLLLVSLFLLGCQSTGTLSEYARTIGEGAKPGFRIKELIEKEKGNPLQVFLKGYSHLYKNFQFQSEPPGEDVVKPAEVTLSQKPYRGDCEDFCVMVMALCKHLNLASRIGLGKSSRGPHAMTEVLVTKDKVKAVFIDLFKKEVGTEPSFSKDKRGIWLEVEGFPPRKHIKNFKVEYYVYPDGKWERAAH